MAKGFFLIFTLLFLNASSLFASPVQDLSFTDMKGSSWNWAKMKGTPVVINIGSHWWNKCKKEAPELQRAYLTYKNQGVQFLGVFVMSMEEDIKKFAEKYHLSFPVGKNTGVAEALGASTIPETIFINKKGQIVRRHKGSIDFEELKSGISEIIHMEFSPAIKK